MLKEVTLFERVEPAPPDPILGLTEAFRADSNPDKIDLSVGVYKDASNQTPVLETVKQAEHQAAWHLIDARDAVLGRMAVEIARRLQGKHLPTVSEHFDCGDAVVVVNASDVRVTGSKAEQKVYYAHTGYPGGLKTTPYSRMIERHPDRVIRKAVQGMLPHTKLGRMQLKKLRVYAGVEHRHEAQSPQPLEL